MDDDVRSALLQLAAVAAAVLIQKWAHDQSFRWAVKSYLTKAHRFLFASEEEPQVAEWYVAEKTKGLVGEAERITREG